MINFIPLTLHLTSLTIEIMKIKKILLAEDDQDIREVIVEVLLNENFEVDWAENGLEATKKLATNSYDLLVSDFRMPKMDGAQLLSWCRENKIHFPVIFITANRELFPQEILALNDCCASLLNKPLNIENLLQEIIKAEQRDHLRNC